MVSAPCGESTSPLSENATAHSPVAPGLVHRARARAGRPGARRPSSAPGALESHSRGPSRAARWAAPRCSWRSRRSRRRRSAGARRAPRRGRRAAPACPTAARRARAGRARAAAARCRCRRRAPRSAPRRSGRRPGHTPFPRATQRRIVARLAECGVLFAQPIPRAVRGGSALSRSYASWPTRPRPCGAPAAPSACQAGGAGAGLDEQQEAVGRLADDDGGNAGERAGDRRARQQPVAHARARPARARRAGRSARRRSSRGRRRS